MSRLCETQAFRRFVHHILADAARFHEIYNHCVRAYRSKHGVRSRNHPAPDLARDGDLYELPFWVFQPGNRQRGRLFARPGETIPQETAIRSRALTTTMFARVGLGDSFIHGVGGGIYDEVTDAILEAWLGLKPLGIVVLSGTLRLPLPRFPAEAANPDRLLRELTWNPQRRLSDAAAADPQVRALVKRKQRLIESEPEAKPDRKQWFRQLRQVTAELRPWVSEEILPARAAFAKRQREVNANEAVMRRDFAWMLFPEDRLREWLLNWDR